jgi:hypothetical protein
VAGILLAVAVGIFGVLAVLAWSLGSSLKGGAQRFGELLLWLVMLMQTLADVGQAASSATPAILQPLYGAILSFQLQGPVTIHQACLKGVPPFLGQMLLFAALLVGCVALFALAFRQRSALLRKRAVSPGCASVAHRLRRLLAIGLCFVLSAIYARACNVALATVYCSEQRLPSDVAASLNGIRDVDLGSVGADGLVSVLLLQDNSSSFVCYRGDHLPAAVLAWLTIVVFIIGFPVWSVAWSWQLSRALAAQMPDGHAKLDAAADTTLPCKDPAAAFFAATTYRPAVFFFRHAELAGFLALAAILVFWHFPQSAGSYGAKAAVTCLVLLGVAASLVWLHPHYRDERWRVPVRLGSLVLAGLMAVVNAVSGAASLHNGGSRESTALTALVWCIIVCALLWLLLLVVSVGRSLIQGAKAEARLLQLRQTLAHSVKKRTPSRDGGGAGKDVQPGAADRQRLQVTATGPREARRSAGVSADVSTVKAGPYDGNDPASRRWYVPPAHPSTGSRRASRPSLFGFAKEQLELRAGDGRGLHGDAAADLVRALAAGYRADASPSQPPALLPLALRREVGGRVSFADIGAHASAFAVRNPLGASRNDDDSAPPAAGSARRSLSALGVLKPQLLHGLHTFAGAAAAQTMPHPLRRHSGRPGSFVLDASRGGGPDAVEAARRSTAHTRVLRASAFDPTPSEPATVSARELAKSSLSACGAPPGAAAIGMDAEIAADAVAAVAAVPPALPSHATARAVRLSCGMGGGFMQHQRPSHTAVTFGLAAARAPAGGTKTAPTKRSDIW